MNEQSTNGPIAATLIRATIGALFIYGTSAMTNLGAQSPTMPGMAMPAVADSMPPSPVGVSMDRGGSGTTWIPDAVMLPTRHVMLGKWDVMAHGFAFGQFDTQSGPRGASQFGSLNWGMLMASRALAGGRFQARTMLSLDPATVTARGYPLLLQTGETYHGQALHDRQHPHDFLMELGAMYERTIAEHVAFELYAAPSGEPALGPVAFMHRPSAMDNPAAPLGHHWQDATHVSFGVLTAGLFTHQWKLEGSAFNGREPDENRWNFDPIRLDSYSGRLSFNPTANWSFSAAYGFLNSPEASAPLEDMHRITASAMYGVGLGTSGQWATTAVYGANSHSSQSGFSSSVLLESEAILDSSNTVFGRAEFVQKSAEDLVLTTGPDAFPPDREFGIGALSLGAIREVATLFGGTLGVGAMGTINLTPTALRSAYGSRTPVGAMIFVRLRPKLRRGTADPMAGMHMNHDER